MTMIPESSVGFGRPRMSNAMSRFHLRRSSNNSSSASLTRSGRFVDPRHQDINANVRRAAERVRERKLQEEVASALVPAPRIIFPNKRRYLRPRPLVQIRRE